MSNSEYASPLPTFLKVGVFVRITRQDEWEDLIGIIDEFLDEQLEVVDEMTEGGSLLVYFPLSRRRQEECSLVGVNSYPGIVLSELRERGGKAVFKKDEIEEINPDNL